MTFFETELELQIDFELLKTNLVFLFFSTRVEKKSIKIWQDISKMALAMPQFSFFLFDKTPQAELKRFYTELSEIQNLGNVHICERSNTEFALDTIANLKLVGNGWLMQLHDDDSWHGVIQNTSSWDFLEIIKPVIGFLDRNNQIKYDVDFPAKIQFCFVPSRVYKIFINFLKDQNCTAPASSDQILNYMSKILCTSRDIDDFTYLYDANHWATKKSAKNELTKLTLAEGWGEWSGTDIAMINRNLDRLLSLTYLRDFITPTVFDSELEFCLRNLKPNKLRVWFNSALYFFLIIFDLVPLYPRKVAKKIRMKLLFLKFKKDFWGISNAAEVMGVLSRYELGEKFPKLENRIKFWQARLALI